VTRIRGFSYRLPRFSEAAQGLRRSYPQRNTESNESFNTHPKAPSQMSTQRTVSEELLVQRTSYSIGITPRVDRDAGAHLTSTLSVSPHQEAGRHVPFARDVILYAGMAYAEAEKAAATQEAYASDLVRLRHLVPCHSATPLPAHVGIIAAYLSWLAHNGRKSSAIGHRAAAIGYRHKLARMSHRLTGRDQRWRVVRTHRRM
jgi:hypothetical protein